MKLSVGIVGLPNVGKSTLFNALTRSSVAAENYPFCTIDPSVGVVAVPDERLQTLSQLSGSAETIPAIVEFVDIAGLVKGASAGEGLGNQFLSNIREVDMVAEVVRIFEDADVHHVAGVVDPMSDIEVINLELVLADTATVAKRLSNLERDVKRQDKAAVAEHDALAPLQRHLEAGQLAHGYHASSEAAPHIAALNLLTNKPFLYVLNRKQGAFNLDEQNDPRWQELMDFMTQSGSAYVVVDAGLEHELKDLAEAEKTEFRREYGAQDSGVESLIRTAYNHLGLMSFFTTGEKETRAWTILIGSTTPDAGAAIHTDFRDKFIRAQVVSFADLVSAGSMSAARDAGRLRTEGKEYLVQEGDVIEFLHS